MGSCTRFTVRAAAGLALVALVGAQSSCSAVPAPPVHDGPVHAERHTWGGMCATGPCTSDLVVEDDGTWTYSSSEADGASGHLSATELDTLRAAVADTAVGSPGPAADECAADVDDTSVRYAWTVDDDSGAASSCETVIDRTDPLVRYLDELAASVD